MKFMKQILYSSAKMKVNGEWKDTHKIVYLSLFLSMFHRCVCIHLIEEIHKYLSFPLYLIILVIQ